MVLRGGYSLPSAKFSSVTMSAIAWKIKPQLKSHQGKRAAYIQDL